MYLPLLNKQIFFTRGNVILMHDHAMESVMGMK